MMNEQQVDLKQAALIGVNWIRCSGSNTLKVFNPANGELLGTVPKLSEEQVHYAITIAEQAFNSWRKNSINERCAVLNKWYQKIKENEARLASIITLEQGKPFSEALGEVRYAASYIKWYSQPALQDNGSEMPNGSANESLKTVTEPVGVCAAITPWNFPAAMLTRKVAPALAVGCSMIIKPAPETPFTALALSELALRAGVPPGLINVVTGDAQLIGDIVCTSKQVKKLSFTGSTAVGRHLMRTCASTVKRLSLELGGNAPFIVCSDADIDKAVEGAMQSKFRNAGQTCVCANALYVHDSLYDRFASAFEKRIKALSLGSGSDPHIDIGPLINEQALEKVEALVRDAREKGGNIVYGGERWAESERWYLPTLITEATTDMRCVQEEVFGPVAPLVRYSDEDSLIASLRAQDTGLAAYFYSESLKRIHYLAAELEVGMVGVNTGVISDPAMPFGGVKSSGLGREGGRQGIMEYLETKYIKLCY